MPLLEQSRLPRGLPNRHGLYDAVFIQHAEYENNHGVVPESREALEISLAYG